MLIYTGFLGNEVFHVADLGTGALVPYGAPEVRIGYGELVVSEIGQPSAKR